MFCETAALIRFSQPLTYLLETGVATTTLLWKPPCLLHNMKFTKFILRTVLSKYFVINCHCLHINLIFTCKEALEGLLKHFSQKSREVAVHLIHSCLLLRMRGSLTSLMGTCLIRFNFYYYCILLNIFVINNLNIEITHIANIQRNAALIFLRLSRLIFEFPYDIFRTHSKQKKYLRNIFVK